MLPYSSTHSLNGVDSQASSSCSGNIRSSSPSVGGNMARPRHHVRSFSQEKRFGDSTSTSSMSTTPLSSPPIKQALPVRAKRSPSIESTEQGYSTPSTASSSRTSSTSSQQPMPRVHNSHNVIPDSPQREPSPPAALTKTEKDEKEQLAKLRQAQASRRPRVMRMTPAFSSLPGRINSDLAKSVLNAQGKGDNVEFPSKDGAGLEEPSAGLQIDLACIPSPSLQDLQGPVTESRLDSIIRDRHGNPIKPSLKTPRSSVSHFLPGRTTRSDSTPSLPMGNLTSKSVPTTPTVPKNVHFDSQLEHVKVFKFKQRPTAVSRDGSPEQTETETEEEKEMFPYIWKKNGNSSNDNSPSSPSRARSNSPPVDEQLVLRLPNFPSSTRLSVDREVFLERIYLAEDLRSVKGTVQVRNMSFEKWVAVRYSLDHWATIGEVSAEYAESIKGGQADRFTFSIKLNELLNWPRGSAAHETKSMFICLRYTVSDGEFWDNNEGHNYQLDFRRRPMPSTPVSTPMPNSVPPRANVPDSVASASTRARVMEMARRGVGGRGVFAMEDLKRELEKLRSDDEEEIPSPIDSLRKRASPPASPGLPHSRSASPSVWTARYDFGQSLRNPRSGSRKTGEGRAAALDYFSARPMNVAAANSVPANTSSTSSAPLFTVQAASPPSNKTDLVTALPASSFNARFGMISPGLGDENVEHMPVNASTTPSPAVTPTLAIQTMNGSYSPERFHSFPPSRHVSSPGSTTPTGPNRLSPVSSMDMLRNNSRDKAFSPLKASSTIPQASLMTRTDELGSVKHEKGGSSSSTEESLQSSPHSSPPSDGGSPNPFSPSMSISSMESDTTVSNMTSPESLHSVMKGAISGRNPATIQPTYLQPINGSSADLNGSAVSLTSLSSSDSNETEDGSNSTRQFRPASMSDYQELVNKFCWNSDLVPSGGSMVPDMPINGGFGNASVLIDGQPIHAVAPLSPNYPTNGSGSGSSTPTRSH
ncbi:hypothetical protein L7F22_003096 [Adiantum nelumboides]|nr:hypothetical protein [Adiantum nelumboides]